MNQVNQQLINELSLKDRLSREKQLSEQLGPLQQQLETVRRTGPVNGIGEEHLSALIGQHQELIGELRSSIDKELSPDKVKGQSEISNIAENYLARHGKVQATVQTSSRPTIEGLSQQELKQIKLINDKIAAPFFNDKVREYPTLEVSLQDMANQISCLGCLTDK